MSTTTNIADMQNAFALLMEQVRRLGAPATPVAPAEPKRTGKRTGKTLTPEHKAKMAEGRRKAAAGRKAAPQTAAPAAAPAAAPVAHTPAEFTITSPHGDVRFTTGVNKAGKGYILMHVHEGHGGALVIHNEDHLKRIFFPLRTCDTAQLAGLLSFVAKHGR